MIQLAHSPYHGVPLRGLGQLISVPRPYQQVETSTAPAPIKSTTSSSTSTTSTTSSLDQPWYKRPSILIGGVVGLAAIGALGWWAFK